MLTITEIQHAVADHYRIPRSAMHGKCKARWVAFPRQVAMVLCRELTKASYPELGKRFNRDHTTVLYAPRALYGRIAAGSSEAIDLEHIRKQLTLPRPTLKTRSAAEMSACMFLEHIAELMSERPKLETLMLAQFRNLAPYAERHGVVAGRPA